MEWWNMLTKAGRERWSDETCSLRLGERWSDETCSLRLGERWSDETCSLRLGERWSDETCSLRLGERWMDRRDKLQLISAVDFSNAKNAQVTWLAIIIFNEAWCWYWIPYLNPNDTHTIFLEIPSKELELPPKHWLKSWRTDGRWTDGWRGWVHYNPPPPPPPPTLLLRNI